MSDILNRILAAKAAEVSQRTKRMPLAQMRSRCESAVPIRGFIDAIERTIRMGKPAVISEIKKASPSKGVLRKSFDPAEIARSYSSNGATCLSVLTDEPYFLGHDDHINQVRSVCSLPVLRKDFMIGPYQVYESRVIGADAILLIVAALDDVTLRQLAELASDLQLDVLVEVHCQHDLDRALNLPCRLIGINNRNLHTFETSLNTTINLVKQIPEDRIVVTESGIHTAGDVVRVRSHQVNAFLVGEVLMRAEHPGAKLRQLFS